MAKTKSIRVFQLAKELGVTSKDLIAKCEAEEIPDITNHMSTVSAGLAATIREWFGEGGGNVATAVETAAPVDVSQARAKAKKKASKKAKKPAAKKAPVAEAKTKADEDTNAVAIAKEETEARAKPVAKPTEEAAKPEQEAPAEAPREAAAPAAEAPAEAPPESAPAESAKPKMNVPDRPESVAPIGPKLEQPKKTKLAGPKVIRVEAPDEVPAPRRKAPARAGGPMGRGGPRGGRGAGTIVPDEGAPIRPGVVGRSRGDAGSRRNKRRSASAGGDRRSGRDQGEFRSGNWREQDLREREQRLSRSGGFFKAARRDNLKRTTGGGQRAQTAAETGGKVTVEEPITIKDLSAATGIKANDIVKTLFLAGKPVTINSTIDAESAVEAMLEYEIDLEVVEQMSAEEQIEEQFKQREMADERPRAPVVTILGHVDHGKTSLLDRIRKTHVAEGEAGGITQATSAFRTQIEVGDEEHAITFIDTPGHEAFTTMRARGAKVTDVVVLVVAADDGVMPQTVESINHAKAAGVPIVVALNKIDKPEATDSNIQRILGQLAEHELNPVDWGGQTEVVRTSAATGEGIQDLLEVLDYQAQLLGLSADFGGQAEGTVLEARMQEGRGAVANVLMQQGRLKKGDFIVVGRAFGRVRDIVDDRGQRIDEALPSNPVTISGLNDVPDAGDRFYVVQSIKAAEAAADERRQHERERELAREKVTLDNIFEHMAGQDIKELPLVIKADVQGSLETLKAVLEKIKNDEVAVSIKHAGIGGVNDSDILLASTTGAIIIGFNVTASAKARKAAEANGVDIRLYDVIYDVTDDVTKAAEGMLEPELKLEVTGHAEVRDVFKISRVGMIAGCYVTDGVIERHTKIRVTRDDIVIEKDRRLEQLKRFKDDVKEVRAGQECGMKIEGYDDIRVGDVLECYKTLEVRRSLSD